MHKAVLVAVALAACAQAAGMAAVALTSARSGKRFGDVRGAKPLAVTGLVIAVALVLLALAS